MIGNYFWGGAAAPYEIEQSLRFDRSSYLSRTFTTGNGRIWSLSVWLKRAGGIGDNDRDILGAYTGTYPRIGLVECGAGPSADHFGIDQGGPSGNGSYYANGRRRDPSAWYHLVISVDYNTPSAKIWVNGVLEGAAQNSLAADGGLLNTAIPHQIGGRVTGSSTSNRWDGYMAEFHFLDTDSQLSDPYDFGEFDDNGVWRPIEYTGSHGDAGFYLKFDPSATNGIGHDHSGNGNHWTPTGFTTSGTGTDVMSDTPTTNYATINPLDSKGTPSNGNLQSTVVSSQPRACASGFAVPSGKWYMEATMGSTTDNKLQIGIVEASWDCLSSNSSFPGNSTDSVFYFSNNGRIYVDGGADQAYGATYANGDVIGIALNMDDDEITFYKNGTSQGTYTTKTFVGPYKFAAYLGTSSGSGNVTVNFGQRPFEYTQPTGFKAWSTSNLSAPTVKDGSEYFNTVLYTGNGSTQSITGVGFQSDFTWIKTRSVVNGSHALIDAVRGATKVLKSQSTDAEGTFVNSLTSFDADGFSVGSEGFSNYNTANLVAWNWKAGGTGSSNTAGSITSTVSANPSAGFSIITYSGNSINNSTIGHGLGVAPSMIITKVRTGASNEGWPVWHASLGGNTKYLQLNQTSSVGTDSNIYGGSNNTAPTSTVYSVGSGGVTNTSGRTYVAYCFAEVEGYSKFGSYTGNGNNDGPFVFLGFRPALILTKRTNSTSNWVIQDSTRQTYNPSDAWLRPNTSNAEGTTNPDLDLDFLSNGFKVRNNGTDNNISGSTYIFMALAENPFGGDGVSPATAR